MKIKQGFLLHEVCGEFMVVPAGEDNVGFSKIISLNESAAHVWRAVAGKDFSLGDMVEALRGEYLVDESVANADCENLLNLWVQSGLIDMS